MPWYYRVRTAINAAAPFLAPTQQTNLALSRERHPKEEDPLASPNWPEPTRLPKCAGWLLPSTISCTA